jgi:uncharacterized protein
MDAANLKKTQTLLSEFNGHQIEAALKLLTSGNTVPFVARYRKEATGNLDEVQLRQIEATYDYQLKLSQRQAEVCDQIAAQNKLTPQLKHQIEAAAKLQTVEDLYRPYKPKRRTKATIAKEQGLAPLAQWLEKLPQVTQAQFATRLTQFQNDDLPDQEAVLAGVQAILAEQYSDRSDFRQWIRQYTWNQGQLKVTVKPKAEDEKQVYAAYYDFTGALKQIAGYQTLAINRGEKAGILKVKLTITPRPIEWHLEQAVLRGRKGLAAEQVQQALTTAYQHTIAPAIERELRNQLTAAAEAQAIDVFGENLRNLLLQAPLKGKVVLGFDPAYRTGCKLAIVDPTGKFLAKKVIYPHKPAPAAKRQVAAGEFKAFLEQYQVEMIAIGNGTASRESEQFVAEVLKTIQRKIYYVIINEAGASVYSASDTARAEFPELHVEERSAISIARRLQDPLAELIKIDPQAVGVGQYQHDVAQKALNTQLAAVVGDTVNQVGVNVNTASPQLLTYISGLTKTTAQNIVTYRDENGHFQSRAALKKVPRLGPKAYEQAVGFLRILNGKQPLDQTEIHPESYTLAKAILATLSLDPQTLGTAATNQVLAQVDQAKLAQQFAVSAVTIQDIIASLMKPGRDLRDDAPQPLLRTDVLTIEDLKPGQALEGTVRNVIDFGAFVDIGVKHDGLVHISQLADHFVKRPQSVVSVGDIVHVWVLSVDLQRERVQLTMIPPHD